MFAGEARSLQASLAEVAAGNAFLLQAGDCAESFEEFSADNIREKLRVILQMAVVMTYSMGVPVIKVGRIAGQFAKPRSSPTERIGDVDLPAFRGHIVNDPSPFAESRVPDPNRLVQAYHQSSSTLNLLRAFTKGGFAALSRVHAWNQEFVASSPQGQRYDRIAGEIDRALRFMSAAGIDTESNHNLREVDVFTSHEALILGYEEALTRQDSLTGDWYDCSAHMLWIGERTHQPDGAHVEFLRGVGNPLGCKIGPTTDPSEVARAVRHAQPAARAGPADAGQPDGCRQRRPTPAGRSFGPSPMPAIRSCGPATRCTATPTSPPTAARPATSTRSCARSPDSSRRAATEGVWPGGIHVELTGDNVTECLGGADELSDADLDHRYETVCDPRLNARQSLDLAFRLAELITGRNA